ncbi:S1 RNA-binding domain-containing protein [Candidatus Woesearchaeota archaeon]|nr:S1 RNA-binding domain-containing protein [Candidatus Woesearchaeota archaeon]
MLFRKTGFPEDGELVLCTITKVQPNSVFVSLDEYGKGGMIHISEISPGRIRNIRDFVKEGKKVVCVILKINEERGHIDLSLRRVNEAQKKKKVEYIKQLQKAEKIVEFVAKQHKLQTEKYFKEILDKISKDYDDLVAFFNDIVNADVKAKDYGIDNAEQLEEVVKQRIKPPEVMIEGNFTVQIYAEDGLDVIKKAFSNLDSNLKTSYLGGGKYHISIVAPTYKEAEEILDPAKDNITRVLEENHAIVEYKRITKKK